MAGSVVAAICALFGVMATQSLADVCPNEAIRQTQHSNFLPECRAYEQVTPIDKNGANVTQAENESKSNFPRAFAAGVAPSGDVVTYTMSSPLKDAEAAPLFDLVNSRRTADWRSRSTSSMQAPWAFPFLSSAMAIAPDQSATFEYSEFALAPGAVQGKGNFYIRDTATGQYTLVALNENPASSTYEHEPVVAVGSDYAVFVQTHVLAPGATAGIANLYEYYEGQLHVLSKLGWTADVNFMYDSRQRAVSPDGSRVYFNQSGEGNENALYMSENGQQGVPISVSQRPGDPPTPRDATFRGASADGSVAYFTSDQPLTPEVEVLPNLRGVLYRYDVETEELTAVTPASNPPGEFGPAAFPLKTGAGVSDDGATAYFLANGVLAPGGSLGAYNIYGWRNGVTKFVATLPPWQPDGWAVSPGGNDLAFLTRGRLTAYDNWTGGDACPALDGGSEPTEEYGHCAELYVFDWGSGELTCASCPAIGVPPQGYAGLGGMRQLSLNGTQETYPDAVLDDGTVFFDSPDPLVATDTNGRRDVYEFNAGSAHLITTGTSTGESYFHGIDADGSNVFVSTGQPLVGQDDDNLVDLYDVRVGGGLASQEPPPAPAPCEGSSCLGSPAPPPGASAIASNHIEGAGNARHRRHKHKKRCAGKKRHTKSKQHQRRSAACKGGNR
jgi:hypothetical protein